VLGVRELRRRGVSVSAPTPDLHWTRRWASRHAELLRQVADLTAERDVLRRQVDAVKAAPAEWTWTGADPRRPAQAPEDAQEPCPREAEHPDMVQCSDCDYVHPAVRHAFRVRVTAHDSDRVTRVAGSHQEPQTPAPGSPSTPETLSGPLSAPDGGTA
jgi:hypothetical protein